MVKSLAVVGLSLAGVVACARSGENGGSRGAAAEAAPSGLSVQAAAPVPSAPVYDPCPTDGSICRIMPLGDSVTAGTDGQDGYRGVLFQRLKTTRRPFDFVGSQPGGTAGSAHEGHPGVHIELAATVVESWLTGSKPHVILYMFGTNDIDANFQSRIPSFAQMLDAMIKGAPDALIVVALIPINAPFPERAAAFNVALAELVKARLAQGKHLQLVDMYGALRLRDLDADGVHPSHNGYIRMADVWYSALSQFMHL
jgi:lysophospholipase L1-like esterase